MKIIEDEISRLVDSIGRNRDKIIENIKKIREISLVGILENKLVKEIKEMKINGRIAAVDSGMGFKEFQGFDIGIIKTAGVVFTYQEDDLKEIEYLPTKIGNEEIVYHEGLEEGEIMKARQLERLLREIKLMNEIISKKNVDVALVDGSLVPLGNDKPEEGSKIYELYLSVIDEYKKLMDSNETLVLGVIKDSRGRRMIDIIEKKETGYGKSDIVLADLMLKKGERTAVMEYSDHSKNHPILKDFGEDKKEIYFFYLKAAENDSPLRIEFFENRYSFDEIASIVYSLSAISKNYGYPSPLIEVDLRARLKKEKIAYLEKLILKRMPWLRKLRRNKRPF